MTDRARLFVCQQCAKEKTHWAENCPHVIELWKDGYDRALEERPRPRLTSDDVRQALTGLSSAWNNFFHLAADALNRILDAKETKR